MITFTRTVATTAEKLAGLLKYAHETAEYIKNKVGVDFKVEVPIGGPALRVRWVSHHENLAAWEQVNAKLLSDSKYMEQLAKGTAHVIPGTAVDEFWMSA